jgi:hypothetical protein
LPLLNLTVRPIGFAATHGAICPSPAKRAHRLILDERRYFPNLPQHDLNPYVVKSKIERAKLEACCALR